MTAVRVSKGVDPLGIDGMRHLEVTDKRPDEAHVIDVLLLGGKSRILAAVVPIVLVPVGVKRHEVGLVG